MKFSTDFFIFLIYPLVAVAFSFLFSVSAFGSVILFFGIPALYLSLRGRKYIKSALVFSGIISPPAIIIVDYTAHLNGQWLIPYSILPFRLFEFVTVEVIAWAFLHLYFTAIFYEYFFDKTPNKKLWTRRVKILLAASTGVFLFFLALLAAKPDTFIIPYFYLLYGTFGILIPVIGYALFRPALVGKIVKVGVYFFYLTLVYELTALTLGWWSFPSSQFIGWVEIAGLRFPFEEFFFWLVLFSAWIVSAYEFSIDDGK